jgi:hypothetical protein
LRVDLERLSEQAFCFLQTFFGNAAGAAAMLGFHSKQIEFICGQVAGRLSPNKRTLGLSNSALVASEGGCNFPGDIILHIEQVCCGAIIPIRPNVTACSRINELGSHPNLVATRLDAAFEQVADAEIAANVSHVRGLTSVGFR